jgi:hypothetical protein
VSAAEVGGKCVHFGVSLTVAWKLPLAGAAHDRATQPPPDDPVDLFAILRAAVRFPPVPEPHRRFPAVCTAVALPVSELPEVVVSTLIDRVHDRGGEREVRFDWRNRPALLPVWWEGRLQVLRWGNRDRADR